MPFTEDDREVLISMNARLAATEGRLKSIDKTLHGNGQPGLVTRMARVESTQKSGAASKHYLIQYVIIGIAIVGLLLQHGAAAG